MTTEEDQAVVRMAETVESSATDAAIDARGVGLTIPTDGAEIEVLRGIDLRIERGEFVAVTGPSGSGKSSLLQLLGGLDRPTAGSVLVEGHDLATLSAAGLSRLRNRRIGFVFQAFNLVSVLSVEENIALPAVIAGRDRAETALEVNLLLERVGLYHRRAAMPTTLSGGEQQRTAVARALVNRPAIVLADEPTGNLDSASGAEVLALFGELHAEGQTMVMVTHDPAIAAQADRVVTVSDGVVVRDRRQTRRRRAQER